MCIADTCRQSQQAEDATRFVTHGLNQKVCGQVQVLFAHLSQLLHHRQIGETSPAQVFKWNVVSPYLSWKTRKATREVSPWGCG